MGQMFSRIALHLGDLRLPFRQAVREAARAGYGHVTISLGGEFEPGDLGQSARREIAKILEHSRLRLAGVVLGKASGSLDEPERVDRCTEDAMAAMELSRDLGGQWVLGRLGEPGPLAGEALAHLASRADRAGGRFAASSGGDPARLTELFAPLADAPVGLLADPAGWILQGYRAHEALGRLGVVPAAAYVVDAARGEQRSGVVELGEGELDLAAWERELLGRDLAGPQVVRARSMAEATRAATQLRELSGGLGWAGS